MSKIDAKVISLLKKDRILADIIAKTTLPENSSSGNLYHDLVRSITAQQLSTRVAQVIYGRLTSLYDGVAPTAQQLLETEHETLRSIGYSNQKARYIRNVAEYFIEKDPYYEYWSARSNEEIMEALTSIKGVGKWTAQMILMFTLEREDIFPAADLGIQMGMKHLYQIETVGKALVSEITEIAENWRPYRSIACRYIWAAKDSK